MKILILGARARYETYLPALPFIRQQELVFLDRDSSEEEILARAADAGIIFADAIAPVPGSLIRRMPELMISFSIFIIFISFLPVKNLFIYSLSMGEK